MKLIKFYMDLTACRVMKKKYGNEFAEGKKFITIHGCLRLAPLCERLKGDVVKNLKDGFDNFK